MIELCFTSFRSFPITNSNLCNEIFQIIHLQVTGWSGSAGVVDGRLLFIYPLRRGRAGTAGGEDHDASAVASDVAVEDAESPARHAEAEQHPRRTEILFQVRQSGRIRPHPTRCKYHPQN